MKFLYYFFLSFCLVQSNSFIEKIIDDFQSNSNYLVVNIKSKKYDGIAIIENDDLFTYYKISQKGNKEEYKSFIRDILIQKSCLDMRNETIEKWGFIKVNESKKIKCKLEKGLSKFIKTYFNEDLTEKGNTSEEEKAYIIKILFDNMRSCYIDDETGLLILNKSL
ncbi:hypothetical protein [Flavobacterium sp.]|uniref:hypothetical protein n=1 Tax=Flavobacterium sp. TaxID=239 RepID=UPI0025C03789|nr:hypothetical protein [Flavobacterium sp.]